MINKPQAANSEKIPILPARRLTAAARRALPFECEPAWDPLRLALFQVFGGSQERFLWESAGDADRPHQPQPSSRFDRTHFQASRAQHGAEGGLTLAAPGMTLAAALGFVQARSSLDLDHWVVASASQSQLVDELTHETLGRLGRLRARFLLVIRGEAYPAGDHGVGQLIAVSLLDEFARQGLDVMGPVACDDVEALVGVLQRIKAGEAPTVLYISAAGRTAAAERPRPGAGWAPAEPVAAEQILLFRRLEDQLVELVCTDQRINVVSLRAAPRWTRLPAEFPDRHLRVVESYQAGFDWCAALASAGCHPVLVLGAHELQQQFDRIVEDFCRNGLPVTLLVLEGPEFEPLSMACVSRLPETTLLVPADAGDVMPMLQTSLDVGPTALWVSRDLAESRSPAAPRHSPGVQGVVVRLGKDVVLWTLGPAVELARQASEILQREGVAATVVNGRCLQPLDLGLIETAVAPHGRLLIVERRGQDGFGAAALAAVAASGAVAHAGFLGGGSESDDTFVARIVERARTMAVPPRAAASPSASERDEASSRVAFGEAELAREQGLIECRALSPLVESWVADYERVGSRSRYLWQWCAHGLDILTLPCVAPERRDHVCDTKLLAVILGVLLDDVADHQRDARFLGHLLDLLEREDAPIYGELSQQQSDYADYMLSLWREINGRLAGYPFYDLYDDLLRHDNRQIFNTMRYSQLVNDNLNLLNLVEHDLYTPHNMQMLSFVTIDLMSSPDFDCAELGKVREAGWHAQCMGRIGNLVSTWQREINDTDYSSGVFARAVTSGALSLEQLAGGNRAGIESAIRNGQHELYFLRKWEHHRQCLMALKPRIRSFDLEVLSAGLTRLLSMELGSRGLK